MIPPLGKQDVSVELISELREISPAARLRFAKQVLCGITLLTGGILVSYGLAPQNDALHAMFELVKIGVLPIVTLLVSFYFPNGK
jgi:hypothetical protein